MDNCYEILGVRQNASAAEIRRAYRKKAKELHPDLSKNQESEAFQKLVKAYNILSSTRARRIFDESNFYKKNPKKQNAEFNYREWLLARVDYESRAKLIFFDLMHGREDDAVLEYKSMCTNHVDFSLRHWFSREDFMDYGYILAEELALRSEFYDAIILLEQIINLEYKIEYFKLFFEEVIDFTLSILKHHIDGNLSDELALDIWERALDLNLGKNEDMFFLTKMANIYERLGDERIAEICRMEILKLR